MRNTPFLLLPLPLPLSLPPLLSFSFSFFPRSPKIMPKTTWSNGPPDLYQSSPRFPRPFDFSGFLPDSDESKIGPDCPAAVAVAAVAVAAPGCEEYRGIGIEREEGPGRNARKSVEFAKFRRASGDTNSLARISILSDAMPDVRRLLLSLIVDSRDKGVSFRGNKIFFVISDTHRRCIPVERTVFSSLVTLP